MACHVAEPVGRALPDAHRRKVRRLQRGDVPLVDAVIGDAVEPDLAVRPRLRARPFDAVVEILGLARREMVDHAGRAAGAAGIDAHAGIVVRHPFLGIDDLPVLVLVGGVCGDVGMLLDHALPGARIALLEGEALGVGAVAQDHRIFAGLHRPEHVGAQHEAVVHLDRHVPIDVHAVAHLAARLMGFGRLCRGPVGAFVQSHDAFLVDRVSEQRIPADLVLRSLRSRRLEGRPQAAAVGPSFETRPSDAPQDEVRRKGLTAPGSSRAGSRARRPGTPGTPSRRRSRTASRWDNA